MTNAPTPAPTPEPAPSTPPTPSKTSTGLQENIASLLCYVLGFITGIIFLILEPNNRTVKFHAIQSIIVFGAIFIVDMIVGWIPILNIVLLPIIGILTFILWILLMVKAYQGGRYKLPVAGKYAEKWANQ